MEKCSICLLEQVETDIFVPPDECVKIFNNCLASLHSSIAGNCKKQIPFEYGDQFLFCKMCFDSAFQLNQVSEQLSAFQKQLSDLKVEFSLSVLYRRSKTSLANQNPGAKSNKQMIEIDVSGFSHQLFPLDNSKNSSDEENKVVEDTTPTITIESPNELGIVCRDYNESVNGVVDNDNTLMEYSGEIENDDLFILPIQNPVEEDNIKLEVIDNSCISIESSNNVLLTCQEETNDAANCFIIDKSGESIADVDLGVVKYECDPLNVSITQQVDKTIGNERQFFKPEDSTASESQILNSIGNPSIILKRMQLNQIDGTIGKRGEQLKQKHKNYSKKSHSSPSKNNSPGRNEKSNTFKQRRARKMESTRKRGPFLFQCELCNTSFKYKGSLEQHQRNHTDLVNHGSSEEKADTLCKKNVAGESKSKNTESKHFTTTATQVEEEINTSEEVPVKAPKPIEGPSKPWKEMTPEEIAAEAKRITDELLEIKQRCKICNISLPTAQKRYLHRQVHERDFVEYKCPYCPVSNSYCSQNTVNMHMKKTHPEKLKQGLKPIRVMKRPM